MEEPVQLIDLIKDDCRIFSINRGRPAEDSGFSNNSISSSSYSIATFLPKNLFRQFHRIANIWFLFISILQLLPYDLSPTATWSTIAPLSLVLLITMVKDGICEYQRLKTDNLINKNITKI